MNQRQNRRRGAAILETSLVLMAFLILTFGMLDLGIGVFRYIVISHAARQGARRAIVHGQMSPSPWGTGQIGPVAVSKSTAAIAGTSRDGIQGMLVGCDTTKTLITVDWALNGSGGTTASNAVGSNVRVTVASPYNPFMWFLGSGGTLSASSTMQIAH
jgi:Flp pilus assembly protein TadG